MAASQETAQFIASLPPDSDQPAQLTQKFFNFMSRTMAHMEAQSNKQEATNESLVKAIQSMSDTHAKKMKEMDDHIGALNALVKSNQQESQNNFAGLEKEVKNFVKTEIDRIEGRVQQLEQKEVNPEGNDVTMVEADKRKRPRAVPVAPNPSESASSGLEFPPPSASSVAQPPPAQGNRFRNRTPGPRARGSDNSQSTIRYNYSGPPAQDDGGEEKPSRLIVGTLPERLDRDARIAVGSRLLTKGGVPQELIGVEIFVRTGLEDLDNRLFLDFQDFEDAKEFKKRNRDKDWFAYVDEDDKSTKLYMGFPMFGARRVRSSMTVKAGKYLKANLKNYTNVDQGAEVTWNKISGGIFVKNFKIGYIQVSEERNENNRHEVSFVPFLKEAEDNGFKVGSFRVDVQNHMA
jgi:hypothetical protein